MRRIDANGSIHDPQDTGFRRQDAALARQGSLNAAAIEALQAGLGLSEDPVEFDDLDDLIGTWQHDSETDQALADQRCRCQ